MTEAAENLTDMSPSMLHVYSHAFQEAHRGEARWGLSLEIGTRCGGSALMFLMLLEQLYPGNLPPHLFTVDPYGYKPYNSGRPGVDEVPIYGDAEFLAMKGLLAKYPHHAHFKMCSQDFLARMAGCPYWVPGAKPFITPNQPGEFQLGVEKRMGNLAFCLLDGDHSSRAILSELSALWSGGWMNPAGIVCVDNVDCDPRTAPGIKERYNAEISPTWAIVRGLK